jgi:HlyD family secretion protein
VQLAACVLILVSGPAAADQVHEEGVTPAPRVRVIEGRVDSRTGIRGLAFGRSGRVLEVNVEEGARFRRGQVLARLDCPEVKEDIQLAEAELESYRASYVRLHAMPTTLDLEIARERLELAEAELSAANVSHERLQSLYAQNGLVPKQDLETATQRVTAAKLDVALHRQAHERTRVLVEADPELERAAGEQVRLAAVRRARQVLSMCEIRGPRDGIVVEVFLRPGEGASTTSSVLSMVEDPPKRGIFAWVPIAAARDVRVGQRLRVRIPMLADTPMSATIAWIAPVVSPANSSRMTSGAAACGLTVWLTVQRALDEAPLHAPAYLYLDP